MDGAPHVVRFGDAIETLGEGPLWSQADSALYWLDVVGRVLHRRGLTGAADDWPLPKAPGCYAFRRRGGLVVAFRNGLAAADAPGGPYTTIDQTLVDFGRERINDGRVDAAGRFWFGTFSPRVEEGGGALYRLDPDMNLSRMDTGATMSNGIAWSADNRTLYFADSRPGRIYAYDFAFDSGEVGPRRVFLDYADRPGRPDGCTVDSDGFLWVAEVEAGRVARYDPQGRLERTVAVPVSKPTSVTFGGPDLSILFVTSMNHGLPDEHRKAEPLAGATFMVETGLTGKPETLFGG